VWTGSALPIGYAIPPVSERLFCTPEERFFASSSMQQAEDGDSVGGADKDLTIGDHRGDEFVSITEIVAAVRGLAAVVKFCREIGCIVGVQYSRRGVFDGPYDAVLRTVGADARRCSGVSKGNGGLAGWCYVQFGKRYSKRLEFTVHAAVI